MHLTRNPPRPLWLLPLLLLAALPASARNLDLSTVPERQSVQLTIYNSEDLTLVRETRRLSFKQGINPLQFSWANTLIDPTSVTLRFPGQDHRLTVMDTTFPHDKPQMLYWNVQAEESLEAEVEISFFTSGIDWAADYVAIADRDEKHLALQGFVRVNNGSGETYDDAEVRLVVGEINLVEKIAELARVGIEDVARLQQKEFDQFRQKAARRVMEAPAPMMELAASARSAQPQAPKAVEKEALGEYFIYTIEGTETIPDGWSKRLRSFTADAAPMTVAYRYRPAEYGDRLVRLYLLTNDTESDLGQTPIPNGRVGIYRRQGQGLSFLAKREIQYVPIGDKLELNLGEDPEVVFELVKKWVFRNNIWQRYPKAQVYRRVDSGQVEIDHQAAVAGWDEHEVYAQRIRNYTDQPIEVEVRRSFSGDVAFKSALKAQRHDFNTVQYQASLKPGEKEALSYEVITRQGRNAKQNRVEIIQD